MPFDTTPVSCRLSVMLARNAPVGVIYRRGPSKLVELIKWHTDTDTFERGQWFKGRIYEDCSDLSPDGSLLIYFAAKLQLGSRFDEDQFPAWTAISRPPWLTALALWPATGVSFNGGGLFMDDETVWLSPFTAELGPHKDHQPCGLNIVTKSDREIHAAHLKRQGHRGTSEKVDPWWKRKLVIGRVADSDSYHHKVVDVIGGNEIPLGDARWADWDQKGRLVFTRQGRLFAGDFDTEEQMTPRELADFNADAFEPREAPAWAQEW